MLTLALIETCRQLQPNVGLHAELYSRSESYLLTLVLPAAYWLSGDESHLVFVLADAL